MKELKSRKEVWGGGGGAFTKVPLGVVTPDIIHTNQKKREEKTCEKTKETGTRKEKVHGHFSNCKSKRNLGNKLREKSKSKRQATKVKKGGKEKKGDKEMG